MAQDRPGSLWNPDLAPTGPDQRTWAWYHYASLWVGMIVAVPGWMLAAGLAGYSALLGPIAGILIADYWLIRRTRLDVDGLYREGGPYAFRRGWNPAAVVAFAAGVLPNLPGFLKAAAPDAFAWIGPGWGAAYAYAWFIGLVVALAVYAALMWRPKSRQAPAAAEA